MATGEPNPHGNNNPTSVSAPATGSSNPVASTTPFVMPSYSEMIMSAIESLNDPNGSNKSSISRHIESIYGNLLPAHSTLLSHHLNRMKAAGQLVLLKNNYLKQDPNAPPRRSRGRPPKPKPVLPPGIVLSPPRPRGRPPKPRDPFAPISQTKSDSGPSVSGRKRGRPPKLPKVLTTEGATGGGYSTFAPISPSRPWDPFAPNSPPKNKDSGSTVSGRKRGRPPKFPKVLPTEGVSGRGAASSDPPRGRGRPPKVKPAMAATLGA